MIDCFKITSRKQNLRNEMIISHNIIRRKYLEYKEGDKMLSLQFFPRIKQHSTHKRQLYYKRYWWMNVEYFIHANFIQSEFLRRNTLRSNWRIQCPSFTLFECVSPFLLERRRRIWFWGKGKQRLRYHDIFSSCRFPSINFHSSWWKATIVFPETKNAFCRE